jgi:CRISPR-associated protein Csm1
MSGSLSSKQVALTVVQQAVSHLAQWSGMELQTPPDTPEIQEAKKHLYWLVDNEPRSLRVLFDSIRLSEENNPPQQHYWQPQKLADSDPVIPYPIVTENPSERFAEEIDCLKQQIREELAFLADNREDWQNLSLLTLILEKFGSFLSFGEPDVALIDKARITAAVAASIANLSEPYHLSLIVGDLSGIQNFIYTISSDGALKSLRARSFYLELVTEEIVQQILNALDLPRVNVIYAGGGNLYILAPGTDKTQEITQQIRIQFNAWLSKKFQGKVYLALDSSEPFPLADIAHQNFAEHWTKATKKLAVYKSRKFGDRLEDLQSLIQSRNAHTPCGICHRDDEQNLKPLSQDSEVQACSTCCEMYALGRTLFKVEVIVRSSEKVQGHPHIEIKLPCTEERRSVRVYYNLFNSYDLWSQQISEANTILLVNDWSLKHYSDQRGQNAIPILLGNYPQKRNPIDPENDNFMSASE